MSILEIYKAVGAKIKSSFGGLRQAQIDMLENGFCEIDGVDPASKKPAYGSPGESISTNINPRGNSGSGAKKGNKTKDQKC